MDDARRDVQIEDDLLHFLYAASNGQYLRE
jgi:hypothetical protein